MQQARYQVQLYSTGGNLQAVFDDWVNLEINENVSGIHDHVFTISDGDERIPYFTLDSLVRVMRKPDGHDWYEEYIGFHRSKEKSISEHGRRQFTSFGRSLTDLLRRRTIAYYATTAFTLKSGSGEKVIKEYVNENAGPGANNASRLRNGVTPGLGIEINTNRGLSWFGQRSYRNLLEVIQEIGLATYIDFDIIYLGGTSFEFRCYYPCRGTDRRTSVKFAPTLGDMEQVYYSNSRVEEANIAYALGSGEGTARHVLVVNTGAVADSPWNLCEVAVDARQEDTYNGLLSAANENLERLQAVEDFSFVVMQTEGLRYGVDYFLGDLITARIDEISAEKKIVGVKLQMREHKETVRLEFGETPY